MLDTERPTDENMLLGSFFYLVCVKIWGEVIKAK